MGVGERELGAGTGLELIHGHGPTVTNLIKYPSAGGLTPPPAGSAQIRFTEEGGEIPPQFEPVGPVCPLPGVGLGGTQRVRGSAEFPSSSSGGLAALWTLWA